MFDLFARISLDTSGYEQGLKQAESSANSIIQSSDSVVNSFETQQNRLNLLAVAYDEAVASVDKIAAEFNKSADESGLASQSTLELARALDNAEKSVVTAASNLEAFEKRLEEENKVAQEAGQTHSGDLNPKIKETGEEAEKAGDKVSGFSGKLNAIATAAKVGAAAVAAVGTAAVAAGTAIVKTTSETAAYADNIDKASQKLGVSAEFYQEWEAVLQHSGTSMSSMTATFKTLANAAQDMSADQQAAFEKLGISINDVANLSTEDLFEQVISGLQNMEEGTERTAIATDLLGRGAMEMGALLNTSAEDTQKMIDTVHDLGGVMSDEAIKAGAAFQDSLQDLQTSLNGLKNNLAAEFLPSMVEVMDGLAAVFSGDSSGIEKAKEGIRNFIDELSEQLPQVADFGGEIITALLEGISDNLGDITGVAVDIIGELVTELISLAPTLVDSAVEIINQLFGFLEENAYIIADGAVSIITSLTNGISDLLPDLIPAAVEIVMQVVKGITDNTGELVSAALQLIISLGTGLISALPQLMEAAVELPMSIAESLINFDWASVAEQTMNGIVDAFDNAGKHFQVWLDNTFSGGTVYGGDIANVDSVDWIADTRKNIDSMFAETNAARENLEKANQELVGTASKGLSTMADEIAKRGKESEKAAKENTKLLTAAFESGGDEVSDEIKKSTAKEKSALALAMEAMERSYKQRQITEEQYQKQRLEYLNAHQDLESDEWTKYYDSVQTYYEKLTETERQAAEKAIQETQKTFKSMLDEYDKQLENIQGKIDSFSQKLTGAYKDFYSFDTDEEGNITGAYVTDKMTQAAKQLEDYYNQLTEFSERGIGTDMISQLANVSEEEGLAMLEYWNGLSDEQLKNLQAHYDKVAEMSNKVSELVYADESKQAINGIADSLKDAVENDEQFKALGEIMLKSIEEGLANGDIDVTGTAYRISSELTDAFNSYFNGGAAAAGYTSSGSYQGQSATPTVTTAPVSEVSAYSGTQTAATPAETAEPDVYVTIQIDNFYNNTEQDIEVLADRILIAIQDKINRKKGAFT
ncbi:MAG: hypothetical protein NC253_05320 [Ruminococcus sp.]|nr:hypothetical protein [Ruminococcus sp.]